LLIEPLPGERAAAAIELWREAGLTRPWNDPAEDLQRALDGPTSAVLAAFERGELIATAMVGHDGHRGWVYYLAVRPGARRRGHGRAMMAACEAWLADRGVPKLNLMVRAENAAVRAFYLSLGYDAEDVAVLSRRLAP